MKSQTSIFLILALCFVGSFSGFCAAEEQRANLTVREIAFNKNKGGSEGITLFCNQSCVPELFPLEDKNPRVVMDMKGVFQIQANARNVRTGGKLIKRVRSYLDKQSNILRIVLDMDPSKYYNVRPMQDPSNNTYVLTINEVPSLSELNLDGSKSTKASPLSQEMHITILRPDLKTRDQEGRSQDVATTPGRRGEAKKVKDSQLVNQGRLQLNTGDFAAAVDTFTQLLTADPQDSLSYRLRGNAYDNLGDRQKALGDWIHAARMGDTTLQSYLDFLKVTWRGNIALSDQKGVRVIGNSDSKRYYLPGMKYYNRIKAYHRVVFQSEKEAIEAGYHRAP